MIRAYERWEIEGEQTMEEIVATLDEAIKKMLKVELTVIDRTFNVIPLGFNDERNYIAIETERKQAFFIPCDMLRGAKIIGEADADK